MTCRTTELAPYNGHRCLSSAKATACAIRMVWDGFQKRLCSQSRINLDGSRESIFLLLIIIIIVVVIIRYTLQMPVGCMLLQ